MSNGKGRINMTEGPLAGAILAFSIPVVLSGILQLLFNAADVIVVGRFCGSSSLAAVGSNTSLINLFVNVFIGISIGTNVIVAQHFGAGNEEAVSQTVHTAILLALISGCALVVIGVALSRPMLILMGTPDDVLDKAALYLRIYFIGMPAMMVYNFGAAILRAVGDTKRPMYFLMLAGVINVIFNLFFVIVCGLDVAGVAIATTMSQCVSAACIVVSLMREKGPCRLELKKLKMNGTRLKQILYVGLPAGIQSSIFAISNIMIQSSVNSFGSVTMAGNSAAASVEGFVYTSMNSFSQAAVSFTSQNFGAGKLNRISTVLRWCVLYACIVGVVMGWGAYLGGNVVLRLYSTEADVIAFGIKRLSVISTTYLLCGIMDTIVGAERGIGCSVSSVVIALTGACLLRIIWIMTIFQSVHTLECLYVSYPISWIITSIAQYINYRIARHRISIGKRVY